MSDYLLVIITAVEVVILAAGVAFSYKVAKIGGKPPLGWVLITGAFSLGVVRAVVFLYAFVTTTFTADPAVWVAQSLTLPVAVLVLVGVYSLYVDFKRVMARDQKSMLVAEEREGSQAGA